MSAARERDRFVLVGVGGQGVLVAANLLSRAFLYSEYDVKQAEIHGMAQRGGSVLCFVRRGKIVSSPLIDPGEADVMLALERLESVRYAHYLALGGLVVTSTRLIPPVGQAPGDLGRALERGEREMDRAGITSLRVDSHGESVELGNPRTANTVLVGALSAFLDVPDAAWERALSETVPPRTLDVNLAAFARGREIAVE